MKEEEIEITPPVEEMPTEVVPENTPETPEEPTPEVPAARHPLFDRIKGHYPDREFASDEDYLTAADEKIGELEGYKTESESANANLVDALMAEPTLAAVLMDVVKGYDMNQALARNINPSDLQEAIDKSDEELQTSIAERKAKQAELQAFMEEVSGNIESSKPEVDAFCQEMNLSPEEGQRFLSQVNDALTEVYKGKITKSFLEKMYKAMNYAKDIEEASETGEIKGRNAAIEVQIEGESAPKGDGMPALASMGSMSAPEKKEAPKTGMEDVLEYEKTRNKF